MSEKGKNNKKKTGLGLAIWILLFLIILIVFLVKQEEIKENLNKSGASALIEKKIGKDIFDDKKDESKTEDTGEIIIDLKKSQKKTEAVAKTEDSRPEPAKKIEPKKEEKKQESAAPEPKKPEQKKEDSSKKAESKTQTEEIRHPAAPQNQQVVKQEQKPVQTQPKVEPKPEVKPAPEPASSTIKAKVCFVAIDSEGPVIRKIVSRSVQKDSPMGDALNQLIAGPSASESKTGCRTLIPAGTRLLGASIKNGVATLNFSEEFQFNQFGAEGSLAQLMQVVYTATEFSTVKSVQILIEGQKRDYLTEGVWIGSPLNRSSF